MEIIYQNLPLCTLFHDFRSRNSTKDIPSICQLPGFQLESANRRHQREVRGNEEEGVLFLVVLWSVAHSGSLLQPPSSFLIS